MEHNRLPLQYWFLFMIMAFVQALSIFSLSFFSSIFYLLFGGLTLQFTFLNILRTLVILAILYYSFLQLYSTLRKYQSIRQLNWKTKFYVFAKIVDFILMILLLVVLKDKLATWTSASILIAIFLYVLISSFLQYRNSKPNSFHFFQSFHVKGFHSSINKNNNQEEDIIDMEDFFDQENINNEEK